MLVFSIEISSYEHNPQKLTNIFQADGSFVDGIDDSINADNADELVVKDSMGDVEDGDDFSVSAIDDCAGDGDNAVVDVSVIVGKGDGDDGTVVDVCAIVVDTSVIDDDDVGSGFVINDDICNGDGVVDDFSVIDVDIGVVDDDDDDIADVFVINEDMGEGDDVVDDFSVIGVYDCDNSVVFVVAVVQAPA